MMLLEFNDKLYEVNHIDKILDVKGVYVYDTTSIYYVKSGSTDEEKHLGRFSGEYGCNVKDIDEVIKALQEIKRKGK